MSIQNIEVTINEVFKGDTNFETGFAQEPTFASFDKTNVFCIALQQMQRFFL